MHPPKIILTLGVVAGLAYASHAQSIGPAVLDVAGGSNTTAGITHEYAIGQVVAGNTYSSASLIVTPGVLQPITESTGVSQHVISGLDLRVYPAPVETVLFLQPAFKGGGRLSYSLYDMAGRMLLQQESVLVTGAEQQSIDVRALPAAQYSLQVTWQQAGQSTSTSYKIQKLR
jgi:hypothetical protein